MQKSVLSKPTVYESFVRSWSTSTTTTNTTTTSSPHSSPISTTATKAAAGLKYPSSSSLFSSSNSIVTSNPVFGAASKGSFSTFRKTERDLVSNISHVRMASTQPLTSTTFPTAQELQIQTPLDSIKTAPGVSLDDNQKVIVGSVLDLFAGRPSLRKLSLWADDATFQDPLTVAKGRKQFSAQWYGLATAFSEIHPLSHTVTSSSGNPITLDLKTKYKVKGLGTEKEIDSIVEIWIQDGSVDTTDGKGGSSIKETDKGRIAKVLDKWDGSIEGGGIKNAFRKLNAVSVPAMVHVPASIEEEEGHTKK